MASLRKRGRVWYYKFIDGGGRPCERKGCPDKRATEEMARAPTLPPGEYLLRWTVRTMEGVKVIEGDIPFTIRTPP